MIVPRCIKCNRPLRSQKSIAAGIGPGCASSGNGKAGKTRSSNGQEQQQTSVVEETYISTVGLKPQEARKIRRQAFDERRAFRLGVDPRDSRLIIAVPNKNDDWWTIGDTAHLSSGDFKGYLSRNNFI